jgi:nucleoside 2-deoxyribosyltransferase
MTLKRLPLVYVAGPYTSPDPVYNTRRAVDAGMKLYELGLASPLIPHLTMFVHYLHPQTDVEFWYEYDLHAMERCDAVYRLLGKSTGADREVAYANELGIPVYEETSIGIPTELAQFCNGWQIAKAAAR